MNIQNFAFIRLNLEELASQISNFDFPGEYSNQDPCFLDNEDGFENCIYDENDEMVSGYTVIMTTLLDKNKKDLYDKYALKIKISFFDKNFEGFKCSEITFPLNESIKNIQNKLLKIIQKELVLSIGE